MKIPKLATETIAKTIGRSPQTDSKIPFLKITPTQLTEHGDIKLVPTETFPSLFSGIKVQKVTLKVIKGET